MIESIEKTPLEGVLVIQNKVYKDDRGFFLQNYQINDFLKHDLNYNFVQDNVSYSHRRNCIRGLHYQLDYPQAKLITVLQGSIIDVAVDIRVDSPTFSQWFAVKLSSFDGKSLLIPEGFAHGFRTLNSMDNVISYKTTEIYHPEDEYSINWLDDTLNIDWCSGEHVSHIFKNIKDGKYDISISDKDKNAPFIKDIPMGKLPKYIDLNL